jgi:hypothetical protein
MTDQRMNPDLIHDILDVLDRHGYARADNEHTGRAVLLISDLAHIYEGAQDHPFGPYNEVSLSRAEPAPELLPGAQDPHLGGVHDADEEPGISGGVVGKVPVHVGEVPDSRQIFGGDCCLRAGAGRERRGRLSRPGPWSAAGRGSAR